MSYQPFISPSDDSSHVVNVTPVGTGAGAGAGVDVTASSGNVIAIPVQYNPQVPTPVQSQHYMAANQVGQLNSTTYQASATHYAQVHPTQPAIRYDENGRCLPSDVVHREPSNIPVWYKLLLFFSVLLVVGVFVFDAIVLNQLWLVVIGVALAIFMLIIFVTFIPKYMDLTISGVVLVSTCRRMTLSWNEIISVEYVPNAACWTGAACDFPRTKFTSCNDGFYFRTGTSCRALGFSPIDPVRFQQAILTSPVANRYIHA